MYWQHEFTTSFDVYGYWQATSTFLYDFVVLLTNIYWQTSQETLILVYGSCAKYRRNMEPASADLDSPSVTPQKKHTPGLEHDSLEPAIAARFLRVLWRSVVTLVRCFVACAVYTVESQSTFTMGAQILSVCVSPISERWFCTAKHVHCWGVFAALGARVVFVMFRLQLAQIIDLEPPHLKKRRSLEGCFGCLFWKLGYSIHENLPYFSNFLNAGINAFYFTLNLSYGLSCMTWMMIDVGVALCLWAWQNLFSISQLTIRRRCHFRPWLLWPGVLHDL